MKDREVLKEEIRASEETIIQLQAEIERLEKHSKEVAENCTFLMRENDKATNKRFLEAIEVVKSEAYREFAERLTDIICDKIEESSNNPNGDTYYITDVYEDIDNLVKEMTERKDEGK